MRTLWIQNPQFKGLADRLRAVHHVQLAQDLLHVVLHGERADLEDGADLEVRFAEVDPLQDVELAHREDAVSRGPIGAAGRARYLGTHPGRVHSRGEELGEVELARANAAGPA